jgi:hypothetical protein
VGGIQVGEEGSRESREDASRRKEGVGPLDGVEGPPREAAHSTTGTEHGGQTGECSSSLSL